jgi:hypothetical protein
MDARSVVREVCLPNDQLVRSFRFRHVGRVLKLGDTLLTTAFAERHAGCGTGALA